MVYGSTPYVGLTPKEHICYALVQIYFRLKTNNTEHFEAFQGNIGKF
jgi:hypothetical protein